ncbi:MAG TPA: hypothetical protein VEQ58_02770 [Polyangiaceae bacterium]|nr:hypothetical protein [Polyangiaceae bacterium]
MKKSLRRALSGALLALTALSASCSDDSPSGGLMLVVTRDGPLPVDRLDLTISSKGQTLHEQQYRVPEESNLPTTFGITSNGDSTATVKITVVGWGDDAPLDRRDAIVTQVPTDRIALLKVVLSGRCSPLVTLQDGEAVSICGDENTCDPSTGSCTSAVIDAKQLPTYQDGDEALGLGGESYMPPSGGGGEPPVMTGNAGGGAGGVAAGAGGAPVDNVSAGAGGLLGQAGEPSPPSGGAGGEPARSCDAGFLHCSSDPTDVCETNIEDDPDNCGECDHECAETTGHRYCRSGECGETVCAGVLADCNLNPDDGCEIDTTTSNSNCLGCGLVCPSDKPYCTPSGCASQRAIEVLSSDAHAELSWNAVNPGDPNERSLTLQHTLLNPYRQGEEGRLLIVGLAQELTDHDANTATYNGIPLTPVQDNVSGDFNREAMVLYLRDDQMPRDVGVYPLIVTTKATNSGQNAVNVVELRNVAQTAPVSTPLSNGCGGNGTNFGFELPFPSPPTLFYLLVSMSGSGPFNVDGANLIWSQQTGAQGAAATVVSDSSGSITFNRTSCFSSTGSGAAWAPLAVTPPP